MSEADGTKLRETYSYHYFRLKTIAQAVAAGRQPSGLASMVLRIIVDAARAKAGLVYLWDDTAMAFRVIHSVGFQAGAESPLLPLETEGEQRAVAQALLGVGPRLRRFEHEAVSLITGAGPVRAWAALTQPMMVFGETLGALVVIHTEPDGDFSDVFTEFLEVVAAQLAIGIKTEELRRLQQVDLLTGLPPADRLVAQLESELRHLTDARSAVIAVGAAAWPELVDQLGSIQAHLLRKSLARHLTSMVRVSSVTRTPDHVAFTGQDAFMVVIPNEDEAIARSVAGRLVQDLSQLIEAFLPGAAEDGLSRVVAGIARYPNEGSTMEQVVERAQRALEVAAGQAEQEGGNVHLYRSDDGAGPRRRAAVARGSERDPKTGLYDREHFYRELGRLIEAAGDEKFPLSVAFIDLDHFQEINLRHGDVVGDQVLQEFGRWLRENLDEAAIPSRFTGNVVAIILPRASKAKAVGMVDRLRSELAQRAFEALPKDASSLTLSAGIAAVPVDAVSMDELLMKAQYTLLKAKERGRNTVLGASD